ncbi:MAG: ankyrin repeat domain-containing protein [Acidobacteria bacterium]|nr:ankyrin repeat domain-containing protein [Acidobacteriota bacterium]
MTVEDLLNAARQGDLQSLARILDAQPELLNARNELGQSAVLLAKYHRQQAAVDSLLSRNPELTLHEACAVGSIEQAQRTVRERGRLIDAHSKDGFTPLGLACFFGHAALAEWLVNQGANVNLAASNAMKVAPVHAAAAARQTGIVAMLLASGADVNARQQAGFTALHAAAQNGDTELVKLLLAHGADPEARSDNNQSPLDLAMLKGHGEAAALLDPAG